MTELSPAAQAVLDAADNSIANWPPAKWEEAIGAAIRAAACEVVPIPIDAETTSEHWALLGVKNMLLAIADELEGH
jgi:hypothetical protein